MRYLNFWFFAIFIANGNVWAAAEITAPASGGSGVVSELPMDDDGERQIWQAQFSGCSSTLVSEDGAWRPNQNAVYQLRFSLENSVPAATGLESNNYEFYFDWRSELGAGWMEGWYFPRSGENLGSAVFAGRGFPTNGQVLFQTTLPRSIVHPLNGAFLFFFRNSVIPPAHACIFIEETSRSLDRDATYLAVMAPMDMGTRTGNGIQGLSSGKVVNPEPKSGISSGCGTISGASPISAAFIVLLLTLICLMSLRFKLSFAPSGWISQKRNNKSPHLE